MSEDGPSRNIPEPPQAATLAIEVVRHGGAWDGGAVSDAVIELAAHAAFSQATPKAPLAYEIAILLTDDAEMVELNRNWRGKDAPTNVLSFPAGESGGADGTLGDIVLAYQTTQSEAEEAGITLSDHAGHLVVHGVLHLLGFDHLDDEEAEKMEDLERKALASLGIADPYAQGDEAGHAEVTS
jgi:probable rRNA maturation factor